MSVSSTALARCKYTDCDGDITPTAVSKVTAIPKAPHHVALIAVCPHCQRPGQYVVERALYEKQAGDVLGKKALKAGATYEDRLMKGAQIELAAIEGVEDLELLWRSMGTPMMETKNACGCEDCKRRRYGER